MKILLLASALLFPPETPEPERLRRLAPHFAPPPGTEASLDERELRDYTKTRHPERLRGSIKVSPPMGRCFTLRLGTESEQRICKPTNVTFRLSDIDKFGRLIGDVSTGPGDFGTRLVWRTPYRVAYVIPLASERTSDPDPRFIIGCEARILANGDRKVTLTLLGGEEWVIAFPDRDVLLPQPPKQDNLWVGASGNKVSVAEAASSPSAAGAKGKAVDFDKDREEWHIPMLNSYEMSADHFLAAGDVAPGIKGRCRYRFFGPDEEPKTGRVECHDADTYRFMYAPVTCIQDLGPPRD